MPPTLAERLGFAATDRIAVIHADDIGMCHAANEGAFEALDNGPATCGSIMVPCPWFQEAARHAVAHPELDLGVHLTLNCEWDQYRWGPVAGRGDVPTLLDAQGFLPQTSLEVAANARPEEVEIEMRAQVQAALDAGIDVTHLDSHMGTCLFPQFVEIYGRLGREFNVPVFAAIPDTEALEKRGMGGLAKVMEPLVRQMTDDGIPILDGFDADSLDFTPGDGDKHNRQRLAELGPGVNYLICHPARGGEELDAICPEHAHQRDFERSFYGGDAGRKALEEQDVRTVGMRAIREVMRAGG